MCQLFGKWKPGYRAFIRPCFPGDDSHVGWIQYVNARLTDTHKSWYNRVPPSFIHVGLYMHSCLLDGAACCIC